MQPSWRPWTRWLPVASILLLVLGLFVFHWRSLDFGDVGIRVGPGYVEGCGREGCEDGARFGITVEHSHEQFGTGFAAYMRVAFWSVIVAGATQLALAALGLLGARASWLPRACAVLANVFVLGLAAYMAVGLARSASGSDHLGPGVWITMLGAVVGICAALWRSPEPAANVAQPRV